MYIFCCPNPEVLERDGDLNNKMQIMPYVAIQFLEGKFYNGGTIQGSDGTVGSGLWCFGAGGTGEGTIQEVMDCGLEKMRGRERDAIRTF